MTFQPLLVNTYIWINLFGIFSDAPGQAARKEKTTAAAESAARDLKAGRSLDVPASQAEARRQLDRLKQAVDGVEPVDSIIDRLARKRRPGEFSQSL